MHRSDSCNILQQAPRLRLPRACKGLKKRSLPGSCFFPMGRWTAGAARGRLRPGRLPRRSARGGAG